MSKIKCGQNRRALSRAFLSLSVAVLPLISRAQAETQPRTMVTEEVSITETQLKIPLSEVAPEKAESKSPWEADLYLELRALRNDLNRPVVRDRQDIEEAEVGFGYKLDEDLKIRVSGASSQFNGENNFYLKEAFLTYQPYPRWFSINLGQKLMSIGLLNELEHTFSSNPSYYRKLRTAKKGIDLGLETELYPFSTPWIFVKGSIYSGQLVRPGDNRMDPAEERPREISLRSRSIYHEAFISRFDQHLAFLDPITAYGAGVQASTRDLLPMNLQMRILAEIWDLNERQTLGPDEDTLGYFVFPSISWKGLSLGYRYSEARSVVGSPPGRIELPKVSGRLVRAELKVTPHFALMGEQVFESSDEDLRNEFVFRAVVDWTLN